jgi:hypothetical protein
MKIRLQVVRTRFLETDCASFATAFAQAGGWLRAVPFGTAGFTLRIVIHRFGCRDRRFGLGLYKNPHTLPAASTAAEASRDGLAGFASHWSPDTRDRGDPAPLVIHRNSIDETMIGTPLEFGVPGGPASS